MSGVVSLDGLDFNDVVALAEDAVREGYEPVIKRRRGHAILIHAVPGVRA